MGVIMEKKVLNIHLMKDLLYKEIKTYYNYINTKRSIKSVIDLLVKTNELIEEEKYDVLLKKISAFDVYLEDDLIKLKDKIDEVYFCLYFLAFSKKENDSSEFFNKKYERAINVVNAFARKISEIKRAKSKELQEIESPFSEETFNNYRTLLFDFKDNQVVGYHGYETAKKLLQKSNFSEREIIILLEKIKINNILVNMKRKGLKINKEEIYKVIDIINFGYEKIDVSYYDGKNINKLDNLIETCKLVFRELDFDLVKSLLPEFDGIDGFTQGYTKEEFEYVMKKLLIYVQNQLFDTYKDLTSMEFYEDKEMRNCLVEDYYNDLNLYNSIRSYMDDELRCFVDEQPIIEEQNARAVYYLVRGTEEESTYFEKDLKDIPFDLYFGIKELIVRFEKNTLSSVKTRNLDDGFPGLKEIKNDQVRILYRHLKDNEYVIVGAFLKKRDLSLRDLDRIYKRPIDKIIPASEVEDEIFSKMDEKMHFGGRRNS